LKILILMLLLTVTTAKSEINQEFILKKYSEKVDRIINRVMNDSTAYLRLGYLCDVFGSRLSGSENLERALDWLYEAMKSDGLDNVAKDSVWVPHWKRGFEECRLISPMEHKIPILAFGGSISTPIGGITAPILVVETFEELTEKSNQAKGKIVVFNAEFKNYGQAVQYRFLGAIKAAEVGALASITRSVTPHNMNSVHTGMMIYDDKVPQIPHGAISIEDALLLSRLQSLGIEPVIHLNLQNDHHPDFLSWNLRGEILGSELPDEIIALGGHIDSWDVGTGAHDNACGCVATWEAIRVLKELNLIPKRTLRTVMWANEENGVRGGNAYREQHGHHTHVLMFEFDSGCFVPSHLRFTGNDTLFKIVKFFEPLLQKIDSISVATGGGGVDIAPMTKRGIPAMSLSTNSKGMYFAYHHSNNDTFDKIVFDDFNKCIATIAVAMYIYADLPINYLDYIILIDL